MKTLLTLFFGFVFIVIAGTCIDFLCVEFFHHEPTLFDAIAVGIVYWFFKPTPQKPREELLVPCAATTLIVPPF
jgi:hypothetical protein